VHTGSETGSAGRISLKSGVRLLDENNVKVLVNSRRATVGASEASVLAKLASLAPTVARLEFTKTLTLFSSSK